MNQQTLDFIRAHADEDVRRLALQGTSHPEVDMPFALDQIAGRQKALQKLPSWAAIEGLTYPPRLSMEQCSSEQTARYKAAIANRRTEGSEEGTRQQLMADLTGGFGVDFSFMARGFNEAVYVEKDSQLCAISSKNFQLLGLQAQVVCGDGIDYLRQTERHHDLIYLDPARRNEHGGRTYGISDCTPDVLAVKQLLTERATRIIIKLSPMLDWRKAIADIGEEWVREVHIVAVNNECKELLLVLEKGSGLQLTCADLPLTGSMETASVEHFDQTEEQPSPVYSAQEPLEGRFLYEPNAAIMKAGCFDTLAHRYSLQLLERNSHLLTGAQLIEHFPGRRFIVEATSTLNRIKEKLGGLRQANVTVRNFPMTVAALRKRLKLADGGDTYIFATTRSDGTHVLLITHKVL